MGVGGWGDGYEGVGGGNQLLRTTETKYRPPHYVRGQLHLSAHTTLGLPHPRAIKGFSFQKPGVGQNKATSVCSNYCQAVCLLSAIQVISTSLALVLSRQKDRLWIRLFLLFSSFFFFFYVGFDDVFHPLLTFVAVWALAVRTCQSIS